MRRCVTVSSLEPMAIWRNLLNSFADRCLPNPSAMLAGIDLADLLIWSIVSLSDFGSFRDNSYSVLRSTSDCWYTFSSVTSLIIVRCYHFWLAGFADLPVS